MAITITTDLRYSCNAVHYLDSHVSQPQVIFNVESGAAIFQSVEKYSFSESVYFAETTITIVGFGDCKIPPGILLRLVAPKTSLGRALFIPYAIIGIVFFGLVILAIRDIFVKVGSIRRLLLEIELHKIKQDYEYNIPQCCLVNCRRLSGVIGVPMLVAGPHIENRIKPRVDKLKKTENRLRKHLQDEHSNRLGAVTTACIVFSVLILSGAEIFSAIEGWNYFDGLYFCMVFSLTIGYVHSQTIISS